MELEKQPQNQALGVHVLVVLAPNAGDEIQKHLLHRHHKVVVLLQGKSKHVNGMRSNRRVGSLLFEDGLEVVHNGTCPNVSNLAQSKGLVPQHFKHLLHRRRVKLPRQVGKQSVQQQLYARPDTGKFRVAHPWKLVL